MFPKLDVLQAHIPKYFEKFSDSRIVLDCTEFFIQSPSSIDDKSLTAIKSHVIFKAVVGVSMTRAVVLVSKLWPKLQFSKAEVEITRPIASAQIHVERKMEQIKNSKLLQGAMP